MKKHWWSLVFSKQQMEPQQSLGYLVWEGERNDLVEDE